MWELNLINCDVIDAQTPKQTYVGSPPAPKEASCESPKSLGGLGAEISASHADRPIDVRKIKAHLKLRGKFCLNSEKKILPVTSKFLFQF